MQGQLQHVDAPSYAYGLRVELGQQKAVAEQAVAALLKEAEACIDLKLHLTQKRQQQKESILSSLQSARQHFASVPSPSSACETPSVAEVTSYNNVQLDASKALTRAFDDTQKAQDHLQHCLQREKALLTSLGWPLQQGMARSAQLVQQAADALQMEDPERELRHTQMMLR